MKKVSQKYKKTFLKKTPHSLDYNLRISGTTPIFKEIYFRRKISTFCGYWKSFGHSLYQRLWKWVTYNGLHILVPLETQHSVDQEIRADFSKWLTKTKWFWWLRRENPEIKLIKKGTVYVLVPWCRGVWSWLVLRDVRTSFRVIRWGWFVTTWHECINICRKRTWNLEQGPKLEVGKSGRDILQWSVRPSLVVAAEGFWKSLIEVKMNEPFFFKGASCMSVRRKLVEVHCVFQGRLDDGKGSGLLLHVTSKYFDTSLVCKDVQVTNVDSLLAWHGEGGLQILSRVLKITGCQT